MSGGTCTSCAVSATRITRGWCFACYQRWLKAGRPESGPPALKNTSLSQLRELPEREFGHVPTDLEVGTAGEHLVCADLLLSGLTAFRTDQNCAYDIAVDLDGRLVRLQVKSTRSPKPIPQRESVILAYQWHVRRRGRGNARKYDEGDFDLLALVGLDIRQVAYLAPSFLRTTVQIRLPDALGPGKQFA